MNQLSTTEAPRRYTVRSSNIDHRIKHALEALATLAILTSSAQAGAMSSLATTFSSDTRTSGNMFNIAASNQLRIVDLSCNLNTPPGTTVHYEVYTTQDTYINKHHYAPGWTLRSAGSTVSSGVDVASPLMADLDIVMAQGESMGFYVMLTTERLRSTRTFSVNGVTGFNADMAISHGIGLESPFSNVSNAQIWNGSVEYYNHIGTPYCFGDGSGQICPCGNTNQSQGGCTNSSGTGASLIACGSGSLSAGNLSFSVRNIPAGRPAMLISGSTQPNNGLGLFYGDGLSCVGGNLQSHGVRFVGLDGIGIWNQFAVAQGAYQPGAPQYFQVLFRDSQAGSVCGAYFNLSNGVGIDLLP